MLRLPRLIVTVHCTTPLHCQSNKPSVATVSAASVVVGAARRANSDGLAVRALTVHRPGPIGCKLSHFVTFAYSSASGAHIVVAAAGAAASQHNLFDAVQDVPARASHDAVLCARREQYAEKFAANF